MRKEKMIMPGNKQKDAQEAVSNSTNLWGQKSHLETKRILIDSDFQFDPLLIAAIVKRKPEQIKYRINSNRHFHSNSTDNNSETNTDDFLLYESQYELLKDFYGKELLANPVKLAMKICDSDTTEATQGNDPTRFDVLHCLAENWEFLVESANRKGHCINLADVLDYARDLKSPIPLHIFILGLSEENKERAAEILNAKVTANP